MELFDTIGKIRDKSINVNNHIEATTQALDWVASKAEYEQALFEITGMGIRSEFEHQARLFYAYVVTEAVRMHSQSECDSIDVVEVIEIAKRQVESYFDVFRSKRPENAIIRWYAIPADELRAMKQAHRETYVRPASKQDRAIDIVIANPTASNKELQTMFRDLLKLTPNGAATYVYNVRKILAARRLVVT